MSYAHLQSMAYNHLWAVGFTVCLTNTLNAIYNEQFIKIHSEVNDIKLSDGVFKL